MDLHTTPAPAPPLPAVTPSPVPGTVTEVVTQIVTKGTCMNMSVKIKVQRHQCRVHLLIMLPPKERFFRFVSLTV